MQHTFLFSGFGGQGVMFAGQLLAYAGMSQGLNVTWIPSYGPEMRGGTAHCFVTLSDKQIGSPVVRHPQVALLFNNPAFQKYEPLVVSGGLLVTNASLVDRHSQRTDITTLYIPASSVADELGEPRLANVVMLGAALQMHPVLPIDVVHKTLEQHISAHKRHLLPLNDKALERGVSLAQAERVNRAISV